MRSRRSLRLAAVVLSFGALGTTTTCTDCSTAPDPVPMTGLVYGSLDADTSFFGQVMIRIGDSENCEEAVFAPNSTATGARGGSEYRLGALLGYDVAPAHRCVRAVVTGGQPLHRDSAQGVLFFDAEGQDSIRLDLRGPTR